MGFGHNESWSNNKFKQHIHINNLKNQDTKQQLKDHKTNKDPKNKLKIHKSHKDLGLGLNFWVAYNKQNRKTWQLTCSRQNG